MESSIDISSCVLQWFTFLLAFLQLIGSCLENLNISATKFYSVQLHRSKIGGTHSNSLEIIIDVDLTRSNYIPLNKVCHISTDWQEYTNHLYCKQFPYIISKDYTLARESIAKTDVNVITFLTC